MEEINNLPKDNRRLLAKYKAALEKIAYISNEVGNDAEHACEMGQIAIEAIA